LLGVCLCWQLVNSLLRIRCSPSAHLPNFGEKGENLLS
jgi:hypothetical protein